MGPHDARADYAGLTPLAVLDALQAVGLEGDGRLTQLNSFENRVFQVMLVDGSVVVAKFYRPARWTDEQIAEEHRFSLEAAAAEVPVVAPLGLREAPEGSGVRLCPAAPGTLAEQTLETGRWRFAVWPRRAGRAPELEDPQVLVRLGRCIAQLHTVGAQRRFDHRRTMDALADAQEACARIESADCLPPDQADGWSRLCETALGAIEARCRGIAPQLLRLHGDCHPGNLLWRDDRPNLVDLDDACTGPAIQDLWMLLSGEPEAAAQQLDALLLGYEQMRRFDRRELRLIEALRLSRMLRHNAWLAQRWADPAFPAAYPDFGSSSYWAQQAMQLREQIAIARES
ncbi:MAG: serine/threonine protein kinase [Rubrivivax sp.]|nr:serine/threonine protein kinase [Rubrivivax sp.]